MSLPAQAPLWPQMRFVERGWLSANMVLFADTDGASVVDTGYVLHAQQTVALVQDWLDSAAPSPKANGDSSLAPPTLQRILNTHLHSDHCGGNATLQAHWPQARTGVPPGQIADVQQWDPQALSYVPTGQDCPRFGADHALRAGDTLTLGGQCWQVHAAPGHDPHSIILFEPVRRLLISADALWQHGFGVVFPEIEGAQAFEEVAATLDVIEALQPQWVLPGHGPMFDDVRAALGRARQRLAGFVADPQRHARYAAKVLLKYKLLEWQQRSLAQVQDWCLQTPYLQLLHHRFFAAQSQPDWLAQLVQELVASGAAALEHHNSTPMLCNR